MFVAVLAALASAFCFALATALQHREVQAVPPTTVADFRLLLRLGRRPMWLLGTAADVGSMALHVFALSIGTLALVQPLGVTGLLFAIPLAALLGRQPVRRVDLVAGAAVVAGLIGLLQSLPASAAVRVPSALSLVVLAVVALAAAGLLAAVSHFTPGRPRAVLLAAGAGTAFGVTAVLVRALLLLTRTASHGSVVVTVGIAIAVIGVFGYLLLQSAYGAGYFAASVATTATLNPLVAVLAGIVLLHETLPTGVAPLLFIVLSVGVICVGVAVLVRSPAMCVLAPAEHHGTGVSPSDGQPCEPVTAKG